ncbi:hypothetical protein KSP40_PGU016346 [Platanthera guangdongensis]|uniref:Uncharacterized protein n=1 Tax=Platanthera guangdongensis TaxID=2320717 RepID=A0ABR2M842_9ASPA
MYAWRSGSVSQRILSIARLKYPLMGAFVQIEGGFSHAPNDLSYGVDMKMIPWCGILHVNLRPFLLFFPFQIRFF